MIAFPVWTSWNRRGIGDFWDHQYYYHVVDHLEWQGHPYRDSNLASAVTWNKRWYPWVRYK